jgi:predicted DCC family thiol-disulfide oxidoreductase YuxK
MTAGIVVYDGDCGICQASARWIGRHVPGVEVVSHHDYGVDELGSVWFIDSGEMYEGADAVNELLRHAPGTGLRAAGRAMALPVVRTCARGVYRAVARNRRLISRALGMNACAVPAPPR